MSAFEQQKVMLLDEMQETLIEFFEGRGVTVDTIEGFRQDEITGETAPVFSSDSFDPDFYIVDGLCVPAGMDEAEGLLAQIHDTESEIEDSLSYAVGDGGIFTKSISDLSRDRHERLILLYARWASLVQRLHGRSRSVVPCNSSEIDAWPEDQYQLMRQTLAKEFFAADEVA